MFCQRRLTAVYAGRADKKPALSLLNRTKIKNPAKMTEFVNDLKRSGKRYAPLNFRWRRLVFFSRSLALIAFLKIDVS